MSQIGINKTFIGEVKRVRVLHDKFASADNSGTWTSLIAILRLYLIEREWQIFIRGVLTFNHQREHLFVSGA